MAYNYAKLLGRIKECNLTQAKLAAIIDRNESTISAKLNNKGEFTAPEMDAICKALEIPNSEIGLYFFRK